MNRCVLNAFHEVTLHESTFHEQVLHEMMQYRLDILVDLKTK
jgi:hypothetical protein